MKAMTYQEVQEYKALSTKLMGRDKFVQMENTPDWRRFNYLSTKIAKQMRMQNISITAILDMTMAEDPIFSIKYLDPNDFEPSWKSNWDGSHVKYVVNGKEAVYVRFLIKFKDGSNKMVIMSDRQRDAIRGSKLMENIVSIGGEGYVKPIIK